MTQTRHFCHLQLPLDHQGTHVETCPPSPRRPKTVRFSSLPIFHDPMHFESMIAQNAGVFQPIPMRVVTSSSAPIKPNTQVTPPTATSFANRKPVPKPTEPTPEGIAKSHVSWDPATSSDAPRLTASFNDQCFDRSVLPTHHNLIRDTKFGKPNSNLSCTSEKTMPHVLLPLYKSGFLGKDSLDTIFVSYPRARVLWSEHQ